MFSIYVHIYNSGYIYIYKVAKDPTSHELPLGDSKMQSSIIAFVTHNHSETKQHRRNHQNTMWSSKICQGSFLEVCYADKRCKYTKESPPPAKSTACLLKEMKSKDEPSHCSLLGDARGAKAQMATFSCHVVWEESARQVNDFHVRIIRSDWKISHLC